MTWFCWVVHSGFPDVLLEWRALLLFKGLCRFVIDFGIVIGVAVEVWIEDVGFEEVLSGKGRVVKVAFWVVFFGRSLTVVFVELMNWPPSLPVERSDRCSWRSSCSSWSYVFGGSDVVKCRFSTMSPNWRCGNPRFLDGFGLEIGLGVERSFGRGYIADLASYLVVVLRLGYLQDVFYELTLWLWWYRDVAWGRSLGGFHHCGRFAQLAPE